MRTITVGHLLIERIGKANKPEEFNMTWRAVPDAGNGLPGIMASGASKGTLFTMALTGENLQRMVQQLEIEHGATR